MYIIVICIAITWLCSIFTKHLVTQLRSLRGNGQRYAVLVNGVETLHRVLQNVETEYNYGEMSKYDSTKASLQRVQDRQDTCINLEARTKKITTSKSRALRASWENGKVEAVRKRLEGNQSTILILLGTIPFVLILRLIAADL